MRVGIVSLMHESNTFAATPTTIDLFERDGILYGDDITAAFGDGLHQLTGFLDGLNQADIEPVPIFHAGTSPSGIR